jgi:hypothetical protein
MSRVARQDALSRVLAGVGAVFASTVTKLACGCDEWAGFRRAMGGE